MRILSFCLSHKFPLRSNSFTQINLHFHGGAVLHFSFAVAAWVGNRQFPAVTCNNKKDGRKEAADVALRTLIAEGQYTAASQTPSVRFKKKKSVPFHIATFFL